MRPERELELVSNGSHDSSERGILRVPSDPLEVDRGQLRSKSLLPVAPLVG
jgi:hypothetical protein